MSETRAIDRAHSSRRNPVSRGLVTFVFGVLFGTAATILVSLAVPERHPQSAPIPSVSSLPSQFPPELLATLNDLRTAAISLREASEKPTRSLAALPSSLDPDAVSQLQSTIDHLNAVAAEIRTLLGSQDLLRQAQAIRRDMPTNWDALRTFAALTPEQRTTEVLLLPVSELVLRFGPPTQVSPHDAWDSWIYTSRDGTTPPTYLMFTVKYGTVVRVDKLDSDH